MPNTTPFFRQKAILAAVKRKSFPDFSEIESYVNEKLEEQLVRDEKTKSGFSKRTFERDLKDIEQIFGVVIVYSASNRGYFIDSEAGLVDNVLDQMLSAYDVLNALKLTSTIAPFVLTENKKPQGTENLYGMLHAIQNKKEVTFTHQKFWEEQQTKRAVEPLAVKEYSHRWYLVAKDKKDGKVKTFGLDRISDFQITDKQFRPDPAFDVTKKFYHCYGVIGSDDEQPSEVVLSFTPFQGKFIKTLPIHHSQETLVDSSKETRVRLRIYPTHDFIMLLLSYGKEVKVIDPKWLVEKVQEEHRLAGERYER